MTSEQRFPDLPSGPLVKPEEQRLLRHRLCLLRERGQLLLRGVKEVDVKAIAADAAKDPTAAANPRRLTEAEFEQLTLAAIRGDLGG